MLDQEMLNHIRTLSAESIARDLCSVQPMPADTFKELYKVAKSRDELEAEGYKPVSSLGLMYIKEF